MIRKITITVLALYIGINLSFALKPHKEYYKTPENMGLVYRELNVSTPDGYNIKTWFFPAQETVSSEVYMSYYRSTSPPKKEYQLQDSVPKPTIIVCDGDSYNMSASLRYVFEYVSKGYNVVTFDWRGFGESSDFPINEDYLFYSEFLIDYQSVINYVNALPEVKKDYLGLLGYSTGAYFSFAAAYNNASIKCVIGRGTMTNFDDFLKTLYKNYPEKRNRGILVPNNYPIELCPINIAEKQDTPTMLIVGKHDKRTPVKMSKKIYRRLNVDKELWIAKDAGHGGIEAPETIHFQEFFTKTTNFYNRFLIYPGC